MGWRGNAVSLILHAAALAAIGLAVRPTRESRTSISVRRVEPPSAPAELKPAPVEPEPAPEPAPKPPKPDPPQPKPRPSVAPADPGPEGATPKKVFDFGGLVLSGDSGGGGIAVPVATAQQARSSPSEAAPRAIEPVRPKPRATTATCDQEPTKPVPIERASIEYPLEARAAGQQGSLILRMHVGEDGSVEEIEVIESPGGLIERSAVETVRRWKFAPATACGRARRATYTIARRFELGD